MKIIGITGGIGSGKSRVLSFMRETYVATICQADQVAWQLQMPGEECYERIVERFGIEILNRDQTINRKTLGGRVFGREHELAALNEIMHPAVKSRIQNEMESERNRGTALFVLEAALILEEHYDEICDEVWYIYTDEQIRRVRLKESRQYSDEKIDAIIAAQASEKMFRERCHRTIDNSGTFEETCEQIKKAMDR